MRPGAWLPGEPQRIGGFTALGDGDEQFVLADDGIPVTILAGNGRLHRNARQLFDGILSVNARMIGRSAGNNGDLFQALCFLRQMGSQFSSGTSSRGAAVFRAASGCS